MAVFKNVMLLKNRIVLSAVATCFVALFTLLLTGQVFAADTFNISATVNGTANTTSSDSIVSGYFDASGSNGSMIRLEYIVENGKAYISGANYTGASTFDLVTMPNVIGHPNASGGYDPYDVEGIYDSAFRSVADYISGINIPSSYKSIGANAFYDCKYLSSVGITDGLQSIGARAFYKCTSLTNGSTNSITVPSTVNSVGDGAFAYCTGLQNIYVGAGNNNYKGLNGILCSFDERTIVAAPAGKDYDSIRYEISSPTKVINVLAFAGCTYLRHLDTVSDTLTTVGEKAFEGCSSLITATMPAAVSFIGADAFNGCSSSLVISCTKTNTSVAEDYCNQNRISTKLYCIVTFLDDKGATLSTQTVLYGGDAVAPTVTCPAGYTMQWNKSYVNVKDSLEVKLVFYKNLKVTFRDLNGTGQVTEIDTFYGQAVTPPVWEREGFVLGWDTSDYTYVTKDLSVNAVWMISLTGVPIEETPVKIGDVRNIDGITYMVSKVSDSDARVKVVKCTKTSLKTVKIPATVTFAGRSFKVTSIGKNAFRSMEKLTTLDLGANVLNIGTKAFYNCKKLNSITVRSKKIKTINEKAFTKTASTCKVNVPNTLIKKYTVYLTDAGLSSKAKIV